MFYNLIDRLRNNLNLTPHEALKSDFIKELCSDLIHGHVVIVDSNRNQVFKIKDDSQFTDSF